MIFRAYLVCGAGFAGRGTPGARATERFILASDPGPRCISGRTYPPFAAATYVRQGCPRRPGQGGSAAGATTPGITGSTSREA